MDQIAGKPYWQLHADKDGGLDAAGAALPGAVAAAGVSDLFVLSHGWGNSEAAAASLYQAMFSLIADAAAQAGDRLPSIGFAGIFWPSLWFPDPPPSGSAPAGAGPGAGLAAAAPSFAAAEVRPAAGPPSTAVPAGVTGQQIADALAPSYPDDPARAKAVARLGELLDEGEALLAAGGQRSAQQALLAQFHGLLAELVTAHPHAREDAGEWSLITADDPADAYAFLADTMGSAGAAGDAQGLGDVFGKIWSGAKDALRAASYYEMKCRAGDVGRAGIGPLLERLHAAAPGVRVHLVGHSFGARLVAFALAGISSAQASPVGSVTLVQGAFSHWSFAPQQPFGAPGALAGVADRVHGPLLATFSGFDWAVGRWYPKASFLSNQDNQSDDALAGRWGGMGGDGFQGAQPCEQPAIAAAGTPYDLRPGCFYRVDANAVIDDTGQSAFAGAHSDIRHPEVAWLIVSAALAGAATG